MMWRAKERKKEREKLKLTFNHNIFQSHIFYSYCTSQTSLCSGLKWKPVPGVLLPTRRWLSFFVHTWKYVNFIPNFIFSLFLCTHHTWLLSRRRILGGIIMTTCCYWLWKADSLFHSLTHILQMTFQMPLKLFFVVVALIFHSLLYVLNLINIDRGKSEIRYFHREIIFFTFSQAHIRPWYPYGKQAAK